MRLILGSQSPRRREILSFFQLPFEQVTPNFVEELIPFDGDPLSYVQTLSEGKARSLIHHYSKATIITADTIVFKEGKLFNKPSDEKQALEMLLELSGSWHSVYTCVSVAQDHQLFSQVEQTRVLFHPISKEQIQRYHSAFHCIDKAGGYGIQMAGSLIVKRMEGCFYNVMGLPINALKEVLLKVGIDLWDHLA